jgi:hypothetical protein
MSICFIVSPLGLSKVASPSLVKVISSVSMGASVVLSSLQEDKIEAAKRADKIMDLRIIQFLVW